MSEGPTLENKRIYQCHPGMNLHIYNSDLPVRYVPWKNWDTNDKGLMGHFRLDLIPTICIIINIVKEIKPKTRMTMGFPKKTCYHFFCEINTVTKCLQLARVYIHNPWHIPDLITLKSIMYKE